ncbi:hypothetical protein B0H11DRAFT_1932109 [Mycena galericulata]|nr:hypothetical protein B0H11DRAFT_1932109 [Mycena galericulata]
MSELSYEVDFTAGIEHFEPIQRTYFVNFVDETNRLVKAGLVGRIRAVWGVVVLSRPQGDGLAQQFEMVNKELEDIFSSRTDWSGDGDIKILVTSRTRQSVRAAPIPGLPALTPIDSLLEVGAILFCQFHMTREDVVVEQAGSTSLIFHRIYQLSATSIRRLFYSDA